MIPLRWKLVGLYAAILAAVIAGFSVLLAWRLERSLVEAVDAELTARARAVGALVEYEDGAWFVERKSGLEEDFAPEKGLYYFVSDEYGSRLLASPLANLLKAEAGGAEEGIPRDLRLHGRHYRELEVRFRRGEDDEEPGMNAAFLRVVCGKDMAEVDFAVRSLVRELAVIGPLVLLASLAGGWLLAGRALRPIDRIARTAAEIGATDLTRRIEVRGRDELALLAKTLNATFDRLQEAFERQTRFTADASHELRTPLSVVAGNLELALKRPRTAEEYRDLLQDIQEATQRMQAIVEGLLTLARADAGSVALRREPVSLSSVCREILQICRPLAEAREVTPSFDAADDVVVPGDAERLKDLVSNLVTNAIRYNRKGGRVAVRLSTAGGRALLEVEDTGSGIPPEDLPHVFERFFRADKARTGGEGGSGLGLAIAKWIAEAHGGTITVSSTPGEGSRFTVSLPR